MYLYICIEYRGNVKWDNDWKSFLNGIFTFLFYKSMEDNDSPADISTIRQMYIDPSKFQSNSIGKGKYDIFKFMSFMQIVFIFSFII